MAVDENHFRNDIPNELPNIGAPEPQQMFCEVTLADDGRARLYRVEGLESCRDHGLDHADCRHKAVLPAHGVERARCQRGRRALPDLFQGERVLVSVDEGMHCFPLFLRRLVRRGWGRSV
jgi:hypothetical protein